MLNLFPLFLISFFKDGERVLRRMSDKNVVLAFADVFPRLESEGTRFFNTQERLKNYVGER